MMRPAPVRARASVHPPLAVHTCLAPATQTEDLVDVAIEVSPTVGIASAP